MDFSAQLDRILEDASVGVWVYDVRTATYRSNKAFRRMLAPADGPLAAGPGVEWTDLMHPEDQPVELRNRQKLLAGQIGAYDIECRVQAQAGRWKTLRARIHVAERDSSGKPLLVAGVVDDVSQEKEMERRYHAIFDRPFQFVGLLKPDGTLLETNRASLKQSGARPEDVLGRKFWETQFFAHSPDLQARLKEGVARAARGEVVRFEIENLTVDNQKTTTDFSLTPLRDADDVVVNIIPEGRDITDLVRTRAALRSTEERLSIAASGANLGFWDWRCDGDEVWFHDQWYRMFGYDPGELPATMDTFRSLCHPDDLPTLQATLNDHLEGHSEHLRAEIRMQHKHGTWRWVVCNAHLVERGAGGRPARLSGVNVDVTERQEMREQLAAAQRLESIGQLAAGVSHEINTPVQYVNDSIYFVRDAAKDLLQLIDSVAVTHPEAVAQLADLPYLQENLLPSLDRALEGLGRVTEIVRSMKEFSHPEQRSVAPMHLNRLIENTLIVARNEYKYVADIDTDLGELPTVICHGGEIGQVLLNVLVNAAHAIGDVVKAGGPRGVIRISTRREGEEAVIDISDSGTGIPEKIRHRVFEHFFTTKEVGKGTGQGLAIAHNVMRRHGGSIALQSEVGQGTTFFIRLPLQPAAQLKTAAEEAA